MKELTKEYNYPELFKEDFTEITNSRERYRCMTELMDSDPDTKEWRFEDWYIYYQEKYKNF